MQGTKRWTAGAAITLAVVQAELRAGRSVRTWLVRALVVAGVVGPYGFLAHMPAYSCSVFDTFAGAYGPRFAVSALGGAWLYLLASTPCTFERS